MSVKYLWDVLMRLYLSMWAQRGNRESQAGSPWSLCSLAMTGFVILVVMLFHPVPAYAACSNPTGEEGEVIYNDDHNVMQYCNGSDWNSMEGGGSDGGSGISGHDPAPDPYTFTDQIGVPYSTLITSEIVQFTNMDSPADVTATLLSGGNAEYRLCADAACSTVLRDWGTGLGRVYNNQYAQFRATSSNTIDTAVSVIISAGGVESVWTILTELASCTDVGGFCWYSAPTYYSCDQTCALGTRGGYNAATLTYAGSDGTAENCESVANALGSSCLSASNYNVFTGAGCLRFYGSCYRDATAPTTSSAAASGGFQRVCACNG